ncbi:MAG: PIN domain-containing protein [Chloroflexi bacterium]|nr:PIN domain-containing protein [Chloroflexota bacterium]
MAEFVVDASVWVAYWLRRPLQYPIALQFVQELRLGEHSCHLPNLALVEVCASVLREIPRPSQSLALYTQVRQTFAEWENARLVQFYELTRPHATNAIELNAPMPRHLRGADSVYAALFQELGMPLKTFDTEIQQRYANATP